MRKSHMLNELDTEAFSEATATFLHRRILEHPPQRAVLNDAALAAYLFGALTPSEAEPIQDALLQSPMYRRRLYEILEARDTARVQEWQTVLEKTQESDTAEYSPLLPALRIWLDRVTRSVREGLTNVTAPTPRYAMVRGGTTVFGTDIQMPFTVTVPLYDDVSQAHAREEASDTLALRITRWPTLLPAPEPDSCTVSLSLVAEPSAPPHRFLLQVALGDADFWQTIGSVQLSSDGNSTVSPRFSCPGITIPPDIVPPVPIPLSLLQFTAIRFSG
jgi:hypothetical protein